MNLLALQIFATIGVIVAALVAVVILACIVGRFVDDYRNRRLRRLHEVAIQIRIRDDDGLVIAIVNIDHRGVRTVIGESAIANRLEVHARIPRR